MTQQCHSQAYNLRKPKSKKTHVSHCSLQHYLASTIARTWKQPRCSSTDEWIKKWYMYTMKYYLAIKRSAFQSVLMRWINLEPIIQSEVSQKEKDKYRTLTHICGIQNNGTEEFIYRTAVEKQTQRIGLWTWDEGKRGSDVWKKYHGNLHYHM